VDLDLGLVPDIRRRSQELVAQAEVVLGGEEVIGAEVIRDPVKAWRAQARRNRTESDNFVLSISPTALIHFTLQ